MKILLLLAIFSNVLISQTWFTTHQSAELMVSGVGFNNTGGPLKFNHPTGIATRDSNFVLCDRFNNRVLIWNTAPGIFYAKPNLAHRLTTLFNMIVLNSKKTIIPAVIRKMKVLL